MADKFSLPCIWHHCQQNLTSLAMQPQDNGEGVLLPAMLVSVLPTVLVSAHAAGGAGDMCDFVDAPPG